MGTIQLSEMSQVASSSEKLRDPYPPLGRHYRGLVLFADESFGLVWSASARESVYLGRHNRFC